VTGWPLPLTYRQLEALEAWRVEQQNEPTRDNWYQMQLAAEVRQLRFAMTGVRKAVKVEDMKLTFGAVDRGKKKGPASPAAVAASKARALAMVGLTKKG
jgi:ribosomal protein S19E (S16A)